MLFMGVLVDDCPQAEFMVTGVLGPATNAHGPNVFLHIHCARRLTACVAHVLDAHYQHSARAAREGSDTASVAAQGSLPPRV